MPRELSGLTADRTSGVASSDFTVAFTALALAPLSRRPALDSSTIGTVPLACFGSLSSSRSVAEVEPVPGSVRLSEVWGPSALEAVTTPATAITQIAITIRWRRAHRCPSR